MHQYLQGLSPGDVYMVCAHRVGRNLHIFCVRRLRCVRITDR